VHGLFLADVGNDWSLSGSIETFAIPVGLFIVVAAILFYLLTRPHTVPGHRDLAPAAAGGSQAAAAAPAAGGSGENTESGPGAAAESAEDAT
jgi:hypothetical protein